jgi:PAS domain S-box-containing protein
LAILEAFAEAASDALLSHGADGCIVAWNRSAERISGYLEGEILGQHITSLFPEHLREGLARVFEAVLAGDRVDRLETELERKDGMPIPVSLSVRPVLDAAGTVVGAVAVAQDVTEKRLAQANLAEVEARLGGAEAQAHVGRWLWDVGTGAVQWSEELHRLHGVEPLDFAGTIDAHVACAHPEDQDRLRRALQAAVDAGRRFEVEYRVVLPDGDVRGIYVRGEPAMSSAGAVVGMRGIGHEADFRGATTRDRSDS